MEPFTKFFTSLGGVLTSLAAVIGGVVALYVVFGGGGEKTSSGQDPPPPTATTLAAALDERRVDEWRAAAEDVCRVADRRITQLGPNPVGQSAQVVRLQELLPIFSSATNEIRALSEPAEIREDVQRLLDTMDEQIALVQALVNSLQSGDLQTAERSRLGLQRTGQDTDRLMAELGLQECVDLD